MMQRVRFESFLRRCFMDLFRRTLTPDSKIRSVKASCSPPGFWEDCFVKVTGRSLNPTRYGSSSNGRDSTCGVLKSSPNYFMLE
ncbi:hypothetical protein J6590_005768 [Homalodisca vitripennis]|nr:hypothetical protein J6590_005768 [Homalodisca vitripennis]